jgi:hypothetical protein
MMRMPLFILQTFVSFVDENWRMPRFILQTFVSFVSFVYENWRSG